jgi:hypothetical protein
MPIEGIIHELNTEIERLTRARDVLTSGNASRGGFRMIRRRRPMSSETKAKIASAMAKAWAARRRRAA